MSHNENIRWGFHNRRVVWDTPITIWADEGKGLIREKTTCSSKKDEVIVTLLKMTRQHSNHLLKKVTGKNQGNWILWFWTLEEKARGSSWKSGATARWWWAGSMTRQGKCRNGRRLEIRKKNCGKGGARPSSLKRREDDWTVHIFRESNEEADVRAEKGARM